MERLHLKKLLALAGLISGNSAGWSAPPWGTQVQGGRSGIIQVEAGRPWGSVAVRVSGPTNILKTMESGRGSPENDPQTVVFDRGRFNPDPNYYRLGVNYRGSRRGGVEITRVVPGTPADALGLVPDQVIHSINGTVVNVNTVRREIIRANDKISLII
jgi:S1-C subfamily serine protease